jgi:hypothetical protein
MYMGRSVTITTPIPTLEEVGKRLKMSKARQRRLIEIVRGGGNGQLSDRHRDASGSLDGRFRGGSGATKDSTHNKKSKRAAAS